MEAMDAEYAARDLPIHWRPIHAHIELENRLGHDLPFKGVIVNKNPTGWDGEELASRVALWYRARYGHRLDETLDPGRVAFRLRGARWSFRLPDWIVEPQMLVRCGESDNIITEQLAGAEYFDANVLDYIEDGPENIDASLATPEREALVSLFLLGYEALARLSLKSDDVLVAHALADNDACVFHLTAGVLTGGMAKWSALQATEKSLKSFLKRRGGGFTFSHDLEKLARSAAALGLSDDVHRFLPLIQCTAGVRYGEEAVSESEAFAAHHASLEVMRIVGAALAEE
jgi:hypothetical protein